MNSKKIIIAVILAVAAVASIAVAKTIQKHGGPAQPVAEERKKGSPSAPIRIVEHIDYQCGACGYGSSLIKQYMKAYPDKIYLEVHFFPLKSHPHGVTSARYAYCSQQEGRFWAYHDRLFETQPQWTSLPDPKPFFKQLADEVGVDSGRVAACADAPASLEAINRIQKAAEAKGVNSTPTFYVNGKMMVGTAALMREMNALLPNEKAAEQPR